VSGYIYGNASYYTTCNGSNGACGSCNNNANEFAWADLTTTGCYQVCSGAEICGLACGDSAYVYNYCGNALYGYAEDCCACLQAGCPSALPPCYQNSAFQYPLLDCTAAFFLSLGGDMSQGRIPVAVYCP
jgi:hypothetical protein